MKHNRSKNAMLLMIIFICSICLNNVWARETGTMDQLEKENPDDVDKMNKVLYYYNTLSWIIHGVAVKVAESHIVTVF